MFRLGVAGVGGMGQTHLRNYLRIGDVKVAALADIDPERRGKVLKGAEVNLQDNAQQLDVGDVRSYGHYREICRDKELDVLSVCLPTDLHADASIRAMEAGKHVFCEKPMAIKITQAKRMLAAAKANGRTLMIGHVLRFWPAYVKADEMIRSDKFGQPIAVQFCRFGAMTGGGTSWFQDPARSGGATVDMHIHDVDTAIWWWGRPDRMQASGAVRLNCANVVHSRWAYKNGPDVQMTGFWDIGTRFNFTFRVIFPDATIFYDFREDSLQLITQGHVEKIPVAGGMDAYAIEDQYFIQCLKDGKAVDRCPPEQSLIALEYALNSARQVMRSARK
jgi:predicted dehydrogenase